MRLAAIKNLQSTKLVRHLHQSLRIGEEEVAALVGGSAACEANRKDIRTQLNTGAFFDRSDECRLRFAMCRFNLRLGDIDGVTQREIILAPARHVPVERTVEHTTATATAATQAALTTLAATGK